VAEDLPSASYAGHYTSVLDVRESEALLAAAKQVIASASRPRPSVADRDSPMAVLVQTMVAADAAGVAFSANPLTKTGDEVVVDGTRSTITRVDP